MDCLMKKEKRDFQNLWIRIRIGEEAQLMFIVNVVKELVTDTLIVINVDLEVMTTIHSLVNNTRTSIRKNLHLE